MVFALVHGAWHGGWVWNELVAELELRGHRVVAPDLPCEDVDAGAVDYAQVVVDAPEGARDAIVVGHSLGGVTIALVPARMHVYLFAFVPQPGRAPRDRGRGALAPGFADAALRDELGRSYWPDPAVAARDLQYPPGAEALVGRLRRQARKPNAEHCPLGALPELPRASIVCANDRAVPPEWQRRVAHEELGFDARDPRAAVSSSLSPRVPGLVALAGASVVGGLAGGRPELVVLAAPFVLLLGVGLALSREPWLAAELELERTRLLEGERVRAVVTLRNEGPSAVELELALVRTRQLALEPAGPLTLRLPVEEEIEIAFAVQPQRWGAHAVGPLVVRARDPLGLTRWDTRVAERRSLLAFPGAETARAGRAAAHAAIPGNARGERARTGDRVRRHSPVRRGRPCPPGQLACERETRHAVRDRSPPRACKRCRAAARHVCGGPRWCERHARRRGAGRGLPGQGTPGTSRPRRPGRLWEHAALARAGVRDDSALPNH